MESFNEHERHAARGRVDAVVSPPAAGTIQLFYQDAQATIYNGDCTLLLPTLPDESVDLVLTDPPYNVGYSYDAFKDELPDDEYLSWQLSIIEEVARLMKRGASLLYLHYPEFAARMYWAVPEVCDLQQEEWITWVYNTHTSGNPLRKASRAWIWLSKETPKMNKDALAGEYRNPDDKRVKKLIEQGKRPTGYDWWLMEQVKNVSDEKTEHPCQVPLEMVKRLILATTNEGDTVFDPFLGSGTTALAAKETGRKFIGCELSSQYCQIATRRLAQDVLPLHAAG